jgi:NAD(P)H-quinone oxidoreductase subunit 2
MDFNNLVTQLNAGAILPEGIVVLTLLTVLIGDLIVGRSGARKLCYVAVGGLLVSIAALVLQWDNSNPASFFGAFSSDPLSVAFRGIIVLAAAVTILMSVSYVEQTGTALAEFVMILLTATLGGMLLSGATELVTIFVSLETLSISSYLMTGYMKRDPRSNEAALKYLLIGASSSAVFLYGISLLYGLSGGETTLPEIATGIASSSGNLSLGLIVFQNLGGTFSPMDS